MFVDKKKFYIALNERYEQVLSVRKRQEKYYRMLENASGDPERKNEIYQNIKRMLYDVPVNEYIGECILQICKNLIRMNGFIEFSQTHAEDMIGDAIENCIVSLSSFDPRKSKEPFSYFTQVAKWAFIRRIEKEQREVYFKLRSLHNMDGLFDNCFTENHDDTAEGKVMSEEFFLHSRKFINNYEQKMERKREKQRKKRNENDTFNFNIF